MSYPYRTTMSIILLYHLLWVGMHMRQADVPKVDNQGQLPQVEYCCLITCIANNSLTLHKSVSNPPGARFSSSTATHTGVALSLMSSGASSGLQSQPYSFTNSSFVRPCSLVNAFRAAATLA